MAGFLEYVAGVGDWLSGLKDDPTKAGIASLIGAGAATLIDSDFFKAQIPQVGYQGKIPEYTAVREMVPDTYDPERRPGSGGQRYFSQTRFAPEGQAGAARQAATQEAANLKARNIANLAREARRISQPPPNPNAPPPVMGAPPSQVGAMMPAPTEFTGLAGYSPTYKQGGIAALAGGRYLNGMTDGMADKVPARIDNMQEARLSDGEFVIPADVVSHLGNGNSNAGAKQLHSMMDRVRMARTGRKSQGKEINPNRFIPPQGK